MLTTNFLLGIEIFGIGQTAKPRGVNFKFNWLMRPIHVQYYWSIRGTIWVSNTGMISRMKDSLQNAYFDPHVDQ